MSNELSLQQEKLSKTVPQNELTLAALRDAALDLLLNKNTESSFQSVAHKTARGLEVDTKNLKDQSTSTMIVNGESTFSPPFDGFHMDTQWKGDYTITHLQGSQRRVEKDSFNYSGSIVDDAFKQTDKSNVTMTRMGADGKPFQTYLPALSEMVSSGGRLVMDPNGQPLRHARPAGSANNCGLDYSNSRNGTMDCNYLIQDSRFGKEISYNETHEKTAQGYNYRSVLRDKEGHVLGITNQSFKLDSNGNLTDVTTSARRPDQIKR